MVYACKIPLYILYLIYLGAVGLAGIGRGGNDRGSRDGAALAVVGVALVSCSVPSACSMTGVSLEGVWAAVVAFPLALALMDAAIALLPFVTTLFLLAAGGCQGRGPTGLGEAYTCGDIMGLGAIVCATGFSGDCFTHDGAVCVLAGATGTVPLIGSANAAAGVGRAGRTSGVGAVTGTGTGAAGMDSCTAIALAIPLLPPVPGLCGVSLVAAAGRGDSKSSLSECTDQLSLEPPISWMCPMTAS